MVTVLNRPAAADAPEILRTPQVTPQVQKLLTVVEGEMDRDSLQNALGLSARKNFRLLYLQPALESGLIEMTIPNKSRSSKQNYRLTENGQEFRKKLENQ